MHSVLHAECDMNRYSLISNQLFSLLDINALFLLLVFTNIVVVLSPLDLVDTSASTQRAYVIFFAISRQCICVSNTGQPASGLIVSAALVNLAKKKSGVCPYKRHTSPKQTVKSKKVF